MAKSDAIQILKEDHARVRALFDEIERGDREAPEVLEELSMELTNHTALEEELVYPAFREKVRGQEEEWRFFSAVEEHTLVTHLLEEAEESQQVSPQLLARIRVLRDLVMHHVQQEENELFPLMNRLMGKQAMEELGTKVSSRHAQLQGPPSEMGEKIDLNSASADEIARIKGFGRERAQRIVELREKHGRLKDFDQLRELEGFDEGLVDLLSREATI